SSSSGTAGISPANWRQPARVASAATRESSSGPTARLTMACRLPRTGRRSASGSPSPAARSVRPALPPRPAEGARSRAGLAALVPGAGPRAGGDPAVPLAQGRFPILFGALARAAEQCRDGVGDLLLAGPLAEAAAGVVPGELAERHGHPVQVLPERG